MLKPQRFSRKCCHIAAFALARFLVKFLVQSLRRCFTKIHYIVKKGLLQFSLT